LYYKNNLNPIIITCGDINGIGPEISLKSIKHFDKTNKHFVFIIPKNVFEKAATLVNFTNDFEAVKDFSGLNFGNKNINFLLLPKASLKTGRPTINSGQVSFDALEAARKIIEAKFSDMLVTAPISKESFELAKIDFPGHTELLGSWFKSDKFLMSFISKSFKAALVTIHEPISKVPNLLSKKSMEKKLDVLINSIKYDFGKSNFSLAILGLNPHAGENGRIGNEEIEILLPTIKKYSYYNIQGPFVPDAFFANQLYRKFDFILGMYHDQILIPFKLINFIKGVNFTAGLPIIRTSPDHGTAFDIAWQNRADETSMIEAIKWAIKIKRHRLNFLNDK